MSDRQGPHELFGGWRWTTWFESFIDKYRLPLVFLIFGFYLLSFNGLWRLGPDSALYLSVASNLAHNLGYTYQGEPHRLAYPGLPYLIATLMRLSPKNYIFYADASILAMGLFAFVACYRLFRLLVRRSAALVALLLVIINIHIYTHNFELLTDIPFLLGELMVFLGGCLCGLFPYPNLDGQGQAVTPRGRLLGWFLLPLGFALCMVMRPTAYALAGCIILTLIFRIFTRPKQCIACLLIATLVLGLVLALLLTDPRRQDPLSPDVYEQSITWYLRQAATHLNLPLQNAWSVITPELPKAIFGFSLTVVGDILVSAAIILCALYIFRRWPMAILWIAATLGMLFIIEPVPRYIIPIIPFIALAWWETSSRLTRRFSQHAGNILALLMFALMLVNPARCVGNIMAEQYQRPFADHYRQGQYEALWEMARIIRQQTPEHAVIIVPPKTERVMTYLTGRWAISPQDALYMPARFQPYPVYTLSTANLATTQKSLAPFGVQPCETIQTTDSFYGKKDKADPLTLYRSTWVRPVTP